VTEIPRDGKPKTLMSEINIIDLAGSESICKNKPSGIRREEGVNINKSLLALSKVIHDLSEQSSKKSNSMFINFRDSKLTRILQKAISGNSHTTIICTLNQDVLNYAETVNTLKFAKMAKTIKTRVTVNETVALGYDDLLEQYNTIKESTIEMEMNLKAVKEENW
jgi:centromeric protein E